MRLSAGPRHENVQTRWESGTEQAFKAQNDQNLEGIYDFSSGKKGRG